MLEQKLIKFIKEKSKKIGRRLNLSPIRIEILLDYDNCGACYSTDTIMIGLKHINRFKDKNFHIETVPPDNFLNRIYFIIAHENAHFLQYYKFPKWQEKYRKEYRSFLPIKFYAEQKIEKNASKIANILLKEYKKENKNVR